MCIRIPMESVGQRLAAFSRLVIGLDSPALPQLAIGQSKSEIVERPMMVRLRTGAYNINRALVATAAKFKENETCIHHKATQNIQKAEQVQSLLVTQRTHARTNMQRGKVFPELGSFQYRNEKKKKTGALFVL